MCWHTLHSLVAGYLSLVGHKNGRCETKVHLLLAKVEIDCDVQLHQLLSSFCQGQMPGIKTRRKNTFNTSVRKR